MHPQKNNKKQNFNSHINKSWNQNLESPSKKQKTQEAQVATKLSSTLSLAERLNSPLGSGKKKRPQENQPKDLQKITQKSSQSNSQQSFPQNLPRPIKKFTQKKPSKEMSQVNEELPENYRDFFEFHRELETQNEVIPKIATESDSERFYFNTDKNCIKAATEFLKILWDKDGKKQTINAHQRKHDIISQRKPHNNFSNPLPSFPGCIAFTTYKEDGKNYCLVSLSYPHQPRLTNLFRESIKKINNSHLDITYILNFSVDTRNFSKLVASIEGRDIYSNEALKDCAEKHYASFLTKKFLTPKHESKRITDLSNISLDFYPFEEGCAYGEMKNSVDPTVKRFEGNPNIEVGNGIYADIKPCCIDCQTNKDSIMKILRSAKYYGENIAPKTAKEKRIVTSDILRSVITSKESLVISPPFTPVSSTQSLKGSSMHTCSSADPEVLTEYFLNNHSTINNNHVVNATPSNTTNAPSVLERKSSKTLADLFDSQSLDNELNGTAKSSLQENSLFSSQAVSKKVVEKPELKRKVSDFNYV